MYVKAIVALIAINVIATALVPTAFAISFAPSSTSRMSLPNTKHLIYCEKTRPVGGNGTTYTLGICDSQEKSFQQKNCTVLYRGLTREILVKNVDCPLQVYELYAHQKK